MGLKPLDSNIVRTADQCEIVVYCLLNNTTHELQLLDKSVFNCWDDKLLSAYGRKKDFRFIRSTLGPILCKVYAKNRQWIQGDGNLSLRSTQTPGRDICSFCGH
ncbi:hypothetical protein PR048_002127 [Dryococelus australis]|uniref:Uncharacterized protein n=1 Tax=Dryococelus australis TaxID=614101 RepID=A0ABQ9IK29_9NEOP|nr:hypothetical protein PR048_002127 [Dryococelus australis]